MNGLCFTVVALNLNMFLNIDFNKQKLSSTCARQMLCLDYSNLEERRNISKLYIITRGHWFPVYDLWNECVQLIYHWVEIKYLGAIQNQLMLFLDIHRHLLGNCLVSTWFGKAVLSIQYKLKYVCKYSKYSDLNSFTQNA